MICECLFNPVTDVEETVPGQSIDIIETMKTGVVAPVAKESFYNALDKIEMVGNRVRDIFDALDGAGMIAKNIQSTPTNKEE